MARDTSFGRTLYVHSVDKRSWYRLLQGLNYFTISLEGNLLISLKIVRSVSHQSNNSLRILRDILFLTSYKSIYIYVLYKYVHIYIYGI